MRLETTRPSSAGFVVLACCAAVAALAVQGGAARAQVPPAAPVARPAAPLPLPPAARPTLPPLRQTPGQPGAKPVKPVVKKDPKQQEAARAKLLQRIRAMRAQELAEVLKPDTAAVTKVVELASGFEDQMIATRQDLRAKRGDLDRLLAVPKPDDPAIDRAVDALMAQRKKLGDIEAERTAALRKALSPNQFARVLVAWPRINRRIQEQLYRALLKSQHGGQDDVE